MQVIPLGADLGDGPLPEAGFGQQNMDPFWRSDSKQHHQDYVPFALQVRFIFGVNSIGRFFFEMV